ncbi:hypothetical protein JI435_152270, partial [Parastagonospora nodorum SN15]
MGATSHQSAGTCDLHIPNLPHGLVPQTNLHTKPTDTSVLSARMTQELSVYMLPHRYNTFERTLYGDEHGFGERTLSLEMVSGQNDLDIKLPLRCRYKDNMPILSTVIDKKDWMLLCSIVNSDRVVRVIFDDRKRDHLAKLTIPGAKPPRDGGVEMILHWEETDDALLLMEKSVRWIKRKLKQEVS